MNKSLHAALLTICTSGGDPLSLSPPLKSTITDSLCSHPPFGLYKHSESDNEWQWVPFFFHMEEFNSIPLLHNAFPCQDAICQIAPLLLSVSQQQNVMEYWWEGSTSTSIPSTVCLTATKRNGILVGRFNFYFLTIN